ncbi:cysteine methyltransferase [Hahella sp. CCB-MM4]|uniref:MGMT family protein n=1 Tax=Hahella sp. (strain CCB-MM4) TaxID=1926491 RepID=UPI000B9BA789|nr:MGMT family protein [Hahella sp. CCB-MM4]OZG74116.1 cysteine methyltransferase [Hahella sp. CCB-MM4]
MPASEVNDRIQAIWFVVSRIPKGKVSSYGQIARMAGLPGLSRYVGYALRQLPEETEIPWFRVLNSQGRISFPPGSPSFLRQQSQLILDGVEVRQGRVNLKLFGWNP